MIREDQIRGMFVMNQKGVCGNIKQLELVSIREVDEHDVATVIKGDRVDLVPFIGLRPFTPH